MELINKLPKVRGSYRFDVNLSKTNWFNVGGNAKILFKPKDIDDLRSFCKIKMLILIFLLLALVLIL